MPVLNQHLTSMMYCGVNVQLHSILSLVLDMCGHLHAMTVLPLEESSKFPLKRWLVAPQNWSGHNWEAKITALVRI
jgi:hypothetical protein